jgi:hypothetical protein
MLELELRSHQLLLNAQARQSVASRIGYYNPNWRQAESPTVVYDRPRVGEAGGRGVHDVRRSRRDLRSEFPPMIEEMHAMTPAQY